jgi:hypothetical protein
VAPATATLAPRPQKTTTSTVVKAANQLDSNISYGLVRGQEHSYYVDSYGDPVVLLYNRNAEDPTYQQLVDFLNSDSTDLFPYDNTYRPDASSQFTVDPNRLIDKDFWRRVAEGAEAQKTPRICSDFAQLLHNNAEIRGIRAGYVSIDLLDSKSGHAINVFNTIDRGLIYIDDTGGDQSTAQAGSGMVMFFQTDSWDKVAYLEAGSPYEVIALSVADQYGFQYSDYELWQTRKQQFDVLKAQYEALLGGRSIVPPADYQRLQTMLSELKNLAAQLGGSWHSIGIVENFQTTWEIR